MNRYLRRTTQDRMAEAARYRQLSEEKSTIPTVSLDLCEYNKNTKVLKLASEYFGMPLTFYVKSHHTGKAVRFVPVNPADPLYDQDHWDGEQQIYRPVEKNTKVDYMVIYNQW